MNEEEKIQGVQDELGNEQQLIPQDEVHTAVTVLEPQTDMVLEEKESQPEQEPKQVPVTFGGWIRYLLSCFRLKRLWLVLLLPIGIGLTMLAKANPDLVEQYYATGFYRFFSQGMAFLTGWFRFSLAEFLLLLFCVLVIVSLVRFILTIVREKNKRTKTVVTFTCNALVTVSCIYFAFVISCGLNYYRHSFTSYSGLEIKEATVEELAALCEELVFEANYAREGVAQTSELIMMLSDPSIKITAEKAQRHFEHLAEKYPVLSGHYSAPKMVLLSKFMSYADITGIFAPLTYEANVNTDIPDYFIPVTMCHELAHLRGFMREDEANFIAYLVCTSAKQDVDFYYSGLMLALTHSMNALYSADRAEFDRISAYYSYNVSRDIAYNNAYWKQYETIIADISDSVNDAYLKANDQEHGTQSYGRMVDLLLADYRQRHSS